MDNTKQEKEIIKNNSDSINQLKQNDEMKMKIFEYNFLGIKNAWKDILDLPKFMKYLLITAMIIILFFNFFNISGSSAGRDKSFFSPLATYWSSIDKGSAFGSAGNKGQAIAVAILFSFNGLSSFSGLLMVSMCVTGKTSQFFWGMVNSIFFGIYALSQRYLGIVIMQFIMVICAPLGWYLFEVKGWAKRKDVKQKGFGSFMFLMYGLLFAALLILVNYEFLPSAYDTIFNANSNPYYEATQATWNNPDPKQAATTMRVLDSMMNGFNFVGYMLQLGNLGQQFYVWMIANTLKLIQFTGVGHTGTLSINMIIEFSVWIIMASTGLYERNLKAYVVSWQLKHNEKIQQKLDKVAN